MDGDIGAFELGLEVGTIEHWVILLDIDWLVLDIYALCCISYRVLCFVIYFFNLLFSYKI